MGEKSHGFEKLSAAETSARLLITKRQLQNLVELGLPKNGHGKESYYLWDEAFSWYLAYKIGLATKKDKREDSKTMSEAAERKLIAEASLAETKLAKERGEIVAISDVEKVLSQVNANVRARLLAIPSKLAPQLSGIASKAKVKDVLEKEIVQALAELTKRAGDVEVEDGAVSVNE